MNSVLEFRVQDAERKAKMYEAETLKIKQDMEHSSNSKNNLEFKMHSLRSEVFTLLSRVPILSCFSPHDKCICAILVNLDCTPSFVAGFEAPWNGRSGTWNFTNL